MGLDISAYSQLERVEVPDFDTDSELHQWENRMWDSGGLQIRSNYMFSEHMEGIDDGWYLPSGEYYGFRAGSYSGYNEWRELLTFSVGYSSLEDVWGNNLEGPFTELINFSDSGGIIGPEYSKKLYEDFINYENEIIDKLSENMMGFTSTIPERIDVDTYDYFIRVYNGFKKAFEIASDNGVVLFH